MVLNQEYVNYCQRLEDELQRLRIASLRLVEAIEGCGDFKNGVTSPDGQDEGSVLGWARVEEVIDILCEPLDCELAGTVRDPCESFDCDTCDPYRCP